MFVENFNTIPKPRTYTFGQIARKLGRHIAIIDLGTNTFHLLIFKLEDDGDFYEIYKHQIHTQLGEGGLKANEILPSAIERGKQALCEMQVILTDLGIKEIVACGTSALRSTTNGPLFKQQASQILGVDIQILSGIEEAELIFKGVSATTKKYEDPILVMDIGGGSVEFIISRKEEILWEKSYPMGGLRLAEQFHLSNPMNAININALKAYVNGQFNELYQQVKTHSVKRLVGAAGSFETLANIEHLTMLNKELPTGETLIEIDVQSAYKIIELIKNSTFDELRLIPGMASFRVKLITVSLLMVETLMHQIGIEFLAYSHYSLKEGLFLNYLEKNA
ncbi:MAG: hypothetical protein KDC92_09970 [Bacteroidetes bacterium]|nr:hypothetical protein [Bacteroidota bacterium]